MKALSILQPWASLIALGHKKIETRSWNTKYRGPLLIHASAKYTAYQDSLATEWCWDLQDSRVYHNHRGAIIGMVEMVGTCPTDGYYTTDKDEDSWVAAMTGAEQSLVLTKQEEAFGDYSAGRFGYLLSNAVCFESPIPCKGKLGLWQPSEDVLAEVQKQINIPNRK